MDVAHNGFKIQINVGSETTNNDQFLCLPKSCSTGEN